MTARPSAADIKAAYARAVRTGFIAKSRETLRGGGVVRIVIPAPLPPSPGLDVMAANEVAAWSVSLQLRYMPVANVPGAPAKAYGVFATMGDDRGWMIVDGPWKVGEGPFDTRP